MRPKRGRNEKFTNLSFLIAIAHLRNSDVLKSQGFMAYVPFILSRSLYSEILLAT